MPLKQSTDGSIPMFGAKHVVTYIDRLRKPGAPVERELRSARLPALIEELPEQ